MTKTEETFLIILKDALHPGDQLTALPSQDWASILEVAQKQNLFPLIYDTAMQYPSFSDFDSANPQYFATATSAMTVQMQRTKKFLDLYQAFLSAGLAPITMKGIICRSLYGERGEFRPSGDEDILIEKKDYTKAVEVLEACGYRTDEQPDKAMKVVQEVTFYSPDVSGIHEVYGKHEVHGEPSLAVELHLNPFGSASALRDKMNRWFQNVFQSNETVVIQDIPIRTMTPSDHFLFLVFHAYKHFADSGFGIRMMLDILLFAEKYGDRMDWNYTNQGFEDIGASGFLADLVRIGNEYLGFQIPHRSETVAPQDLLEEMFRAGTFGATTGIDCTAGKIISNMVQRNDKRIYKYKSYMRLLFPSCKTWTSWKPYLSDEPWMIPVEWGKRMVRYLRGETPTSSLGEIGQSYELAEDRFKLLKKYGVVSNDNGKL